MTTITNRLVGTALGLAVIATPLGLTSAQAASPDQGTHASTASADRADQADRADTADRARRPRCDVRRDGGHYKHGRFSVHGNVIAQYHTETFAPGYERVTTVEVATTDSYTAGFKVGGSLETSIGNKWIGEAKVTVSAELSGSGTRSTSGKKTVTDKIVNNSRHNATFVFYRGSAKKVTAPSYVSVCRDDDGGDPYLGHLYWARSGSFVTMTPPTKGAVRCGGGTAHVDSVARYALTHFC